MSFEETVESLIYKAGQKLGRGHEQVEPFVKKIVHEHWIDTLDALRQTQPIRLSELGVPSRLVDEIYRELEACTTDPHVSTSISLKEGGSRGETGGVVDDCAPETLVDVSFEVPDYLPSLETLETFFMELRAECSGSSEHYVTALKTLLKIIDGVLKDHNDMSRRRLRASNVVFNDRIGRFPSALKVLQGVGFVLNSEHVWVLPSVSVIRLTDTHHLIADILKTFNIDPPPVPRSKEFNPYSASITTSDPNHPFLAEGPLKDVYAARIEKLTISTKQGSQEVPIQEEVPENPRVSYVGNPSVYVHYEKTTPVPVTTEMDDSDDISQDVMKKILSNTLGFRTFQIRTDQGIDYSQLLKPHLKCTLKIQFPDHFMIELSFRPTATVHHVYKSLLKYLHPEIRSRQWYLYEAPVRRILKQGPQTLLHERLVPAAKLYFALEKTTHDLQSHLIYLSAESTRNIILTKSTPPPRESFGRDAGNKKGFKSQRLNH